jgi:Polyketide cyclase / dehydrase and lipid transport
MGVARERAVTVLEPREALDLWLDTSRWPTFVDGFGAMERLHERWPEPGASAVWHSKPGGRGTVTEKVAELEPPGRVVVAVLDDQLSGHQTVTFEPDEEEGGCRVLVELDYKLNEGGPLRAIADRIFIRRALRDSIRRTLERFAVEAAEEAALPDSASPSAPPAPPES